MLGRFGVVSSGVCLAGQGSRAREGMGTWRDVLELSKRRGRRKAGWGRRGRSNGGRGRGDGRRGHRDQPPKLHLPSWGRPPSAADVDGRCRQQLREDVNVTGREGAAPGPGSYRASQPPVLVPPALRMQSWCAAAVQATPRGSYARNHTEQWAYPGTNRSPRLRR